jgi:TRAP-type mannitol/chloroaromatic compound transport system permease small subunit
VFLFTTNYTIYTGSTLKCYILIWYTPFWNSVRLAVGLCNCSIFFLLIPCTVMLIVFVSRLCDKNFVKDNMYFKDTASISNEW